jgi:hypothetical protein
MREGEARRFATVKPFPQVAIIAGPNSGARCFTGDRRMGSMYFPNLPWAQSEFIALLGGAAAAWPSPARVSAKTLRWTFAAGGTGRRTGEQIPT